ncbi:hypothetical protein Tco_1286404, partial [Tanacetum coccineum]
MHIHTLILTARELKDVVSEYCMPVDLHPRLSPPSLTMNKLPSWYIGIYLEQLDQGGYGFLFLPSSLPLLSTLACCANRDIGFRSRIRVVGERRSVSKRSLLRHTDTDLRDDFPTHYNENDASRLAEFLVPLRLPPRHLFYMCGLTTACRHPDRAYNIKDQDGNVINMDTFLKLFVWTETIVSKGDPIPDN